MKLNDKYIICKLGNKTPSFCILITCDNRIPLKGEFAYETLLT